MYVCGYFDQKYNYVGSCIIRVPIKSHHCPHCRHVILTLAACSCWLRRAGMPPALLQQELPQALSTVLALALAPKCLNPPHMQMLFFFLMLVLLVATAMATVIATAVAMSVAMTVTLNHAITVLFTVGQILSISSYVHLP